MMHIPILYRDADLIVVNKPAGVPTHAAGPGDPYPGDVVAALQAELGIEGLGMHQRLDAETSGVLLFAARPEANAALAAAFEGRQVRKLYLALVHGKPAAEDRIDLPIARARGGRYHVTNSGDRLGQPAVTSLRVLRTTAHRGYSLLEVIPETGRTHQIRVHLAHIGHSVVGDTIYGVATDAAPRLCLHAYRLTVPHPATGEPMTFTAEPPAPFTHMREGLPEIALAQWLLDTRTAGKRGPRPVGAGGGTLAPLEALLELAVARRAPLAAGGTDIYRLINGAADGLPGYTVDRYGPALVLSVYEETAGAASPATGDGAAPFVAELAAALMDVAEPSAVYVKYRPREAGRLSDEAVPRLAPPAPIAGEDAGEVTGREDGAAYLLRPGEGWSAGLFPDMRETRGRVRAWAGGRTVLNCFAYTCGFGVAAALGGAQRVLNLDLSRPALERGQANYRANGLAADPYDFVYGDVFDWLQRMSRRGQQFDMVILDPPGFARSQGRTFSAERDYGELAGMAAHVVAPGGLLVACCNVADLPWRRYRDRVLAGIEDTGRHAEVTGVYHAPAIDFPTPRDQESHLKILVATL